MSVFLWLKRGLVVFHGPFNGNPAFLLEGEHGSYQAKEFLYGRRVNPDPEAHPVDRNAQDKKIKQPPFRCLCEATGIPYRSQAVSPPHPRHLYRPSASCQHDYDYTQDNFL